MAAAMGLRKGDSVVYFTQTGKGVASVVRKVTKTQITVNEGFEGEGREHTFPVSAIRKLRPTAQKPVIDPYGRAK